MHLRERAEIFIFKDMKVLADLSGSYAVFPGGGIESKETPIEAAKREAMEECARRVINLTPAHAPSVQIWPDGFRKANRWAKDFVGGYSHWFTGSSSDEPEAKKHKDYQAGFSWHSIDDAIAKVKHDAGGNWGDDAHVRIKILQAHKAAHTATKEALHTLFTNLKPYPHLKAIMGR